LGKAEDYTADALRKIGQTLYELGGGTIEELENRTLHEIARFYYGFPMVVKRLLSIYFLDTFFFWGTVKKHSPGDANRTVRFIPLPNHQH
jgi:hypothetical protein